MPTQHEVVGIDAPTATLADAINHTSCPPAAEFDISMLDGDSHPIQSSISISILNPIDALNSSKNTDTDIEEPPRDIPTPVSSLDDGTCVELEQRPTSRPVPVSSPDPTTPATFPHTHSTLDLADPFSMTRFRPNSTSSFLKPGAKFTGIQRSERQEYEVTVDIQHVDMDSSYLCGYLKIRGLSDAHPTLTTFFEGVMIGTKYTFVTQHPEWGASEKVDWQHWARFPTWRPLQKDARRHNFSMKNWMHKENIWMRWKEYFVVPDHTITDLPGASFDGFYYICFNQISGTITGAYYHHKSEQ